MRDRRPPPRFRVLRGAAPWLAALLIGLPASTPAATVELGTITVEGVGGPLQENVLARLSLAQHPDDEPITEARLAYLLRQAPGEILTALEPFGYYHSEMRIDPQRVGDVVNIDIDIERGPPVRVRSQTVQLEGDGSDDPVLQEAREAFEPDVGDILDHRVYEQSKSEIQRRLLARGYFDVEPLTQQVTVVRAERAADIELAWQTGERFAFGPTEFVDSQIDTDVLRRYLPYEEGEPFQQQDLVALHQRLAGLEYFGVIDIQPRPQLGDEAEVPIEVNLTPAKRTLYTAGLSYGTDFGAAVEASMERRYVNTAGHKLDVDFLVGQQRTVGGVVYRVPTLSGPVGWWSAGFNVRQEEIGDFGDVQTAELVVGRSGEWRDYIASAEIHALRTRYEDFYSTLVYPQFHVAWSEGDHPLYPRRGLGWSATVRAGHSALGSDADFAQLLADAIWIHPVGERNRVLLRGQVGTTWTSEFSAFPPQLRMFAGGDRSVRGYGYQEIGPRDAMGRVIGGRHMLAASAEYEHMFNDTWGVAAFVDAGDAFTDDFDARLGVGFGVRWRSPVGPVRVDIGVGLDDPDRAVRLHLTIGPEL